MTMILRRVVEHIKQQAWTAIVIEFAIVVIGIFVGMIDAYLATRPKIVSSGAPWALLLLGEPARALDLVQDPHTSNDTLFTVALWTSPGATARKLPQFPQFARNMGLPEVWARFGPPDKCRQQGAEDYVCE